MVLNPSGRGTIPDNNLYYIPTGQAEIFVYQGTILAFWCHTFYKNVVKKAKA